MAELITTARPYAEAVFSYAKEQKQLDQWSDLMNNLAMIASDPQMTKFIASPNHSNADKIGVFEGMLAGQITEQAKNLLVALAENGRLNAISKVTQLFNELKTAEDKRVQATVISARKPTVEQKSKLSAALNAKFDAEVDIDYQVDETLISGIRIKVGDWVVDNTAVTQLQKLGAAIAY